MLKQGRRKKTLFCASAPLREIFFADVISYGHRASYTGSRGKLGCHDSAIDQRDRPICLGGDLCVVRHHDYSEVLLAIQPTEKLHYFFTGVDIEVSCWLISQQHLRA